MKKLLSTLLAVALIVSTLSVLMILPATAETEQTTAPQNLIINGDASMGTWGERGYETPAMGEENWGMITANNAFGWRSSGYVTDTASASYGAAYGNAALYWHNVGVFRAANPNSTVTAPGIQVNRWNQTMQDIKIEAGKSYKVSVKAAYLPVTNGADYTGAFDVAIVNEGGLFVDTVSNKYAGVTGKSYDLCDSGDAIYNALRVDTASGNIGTFTYNDATYWNFGDLKEYSFVFAADDVIADYKLAADGEGKYLATLAVQNDSGLVLIIDDV